MIATVFVATAPAAAAAAEIPAWEAIGNVPEPMTMGASVSDGRGNIYLLGGQSSSGGMAITNASYVFNTTTQTYTKLAPMPIGAYMPVAGVGPDGLIYVAGGYNRSTEEFLKTIQIYDPSADTWSFGPEMSFGSYGGYGGFVDGILFVIGGMDGYSSSHDNVQFFLPATGTMGIATSMPSEKFEGATVIRDGKIYCIGGIDTSYSLTDTVDVYDPAYNSWSTFVSMPEDVDIGKGLLGPDGTMYVLGTFHHPGGWFFDWASASWKDLPSFTRTFWGTMGGVGDDGQIYVFGGLNQTGSNKPVVSFAERLEVMSSNLEIASPVISGTLSMATVSLTLPFADPIYYSYQYHLVGPDGTTYPPQAGFTTGNGTFALSITVPVGAPPGEYALVFDHLTMYYEYESVSAAEPGATFTVQLPTMQEDIDELKDQLADAEQQLVDMQDQIDELNAKLDQTNAALDTDSNKLKSAIDTKADSMLSYLTIVLLVVIIALVALMMVRRKL